MARAERREKEDGRQREDGREGGRGGRREKSRMGNKNEGEGEREKERESPSRPKADDIKQASKSRVTRLDWLGAFFFFFFLSSPSLERSETYIMHQRPGKPKQK